MITRKPEPVSVVVFNVTSEPPAAASGIVFFFFFAKPQTDIWPQHQS